MQFSCLWNERHLPAKCHLPEKSMQKTTLWKISILSNQVSKHWKIPQKSNENNLYKRALQRRIQRKSCCIPFFIYNNKKLVTMFPRHFSIAVLFAFERKDSIFPIRNGIEFYWQFQGHKLKISSLECWRGTEATSLIIVHRIGWWNFMESFSWKLHWVLVKFRPDFLNF